MDAPDVWAGQRVFVTGLTGFKGSWITAVLQRRGAQVAGFALPPVTQPNLFHLLASDVETTYGDIRNLGDLEQALTEARPDVVFHMAAQPIVREAVDDPLTTFGTNVMGTANLLDAVRRCSTVKAVVIITSDKCYENVGWPWPYRETEAMGGDDPYSSSKGCAELVTAAYRATYFGDGRVPIASARAGNVIGGGDWSRDRLIPDIVRALVADRDPILRFPGAVRPWQHVLDAVNGYIVLAEALLSDGARFASGWNFGPSEDSAATVDDVARRLLSAWGSDRSIVVESKTAPNEAFTLRLDSSRARLLLGWRPQLDLDAAIAWTATWYRTQAEGGAARDITATQIDAFAALRDGKELMASGR